MTRPRQPSRPNPWFSLLKLVGVMIVAAVLCAGVLLPYVGGIGLVARDQADRFLDTTCDLQETAPPEGTTLYASDGTTVLATIFDQNRKPVPLSDIPLKLQQALIDTEDRRFYSHHGVDVRGLLRSAFSTSGGDTQGGSTLTMQYVKQSRYYRDIGDINKQTADISQTIDRKLQDAKCAIDLEKRESKAEILDNYLNIAFFGENSYSVESAAETYFGKSVKDLNVPESALLVGILRAPSYYDPFNYAQTARDRRNQVLENMVTAGDLTEAQAKVYEATPNGLSTVAPPNVEQGCYNAPNNIANVGFFCAYAENWLENVEGIKEADLKTGGYKIVTTLDAKVQNSAQKSLTAKFPATSVTTALMPVVDPSSGNVLAMVSSKLYGLTDDGKHRGDAIFTDANARAASTYKYFTMVAALEAGVPPSLKISNNSPDYTKYVTQRCRTPFTVTNGDGNEVYYPTENMQSAIAKSSNTYFVGIEDSLFGCDLSPILNTMQTLGMTNILQKDPDGYTGGKGTVADAIIGRGQPTLTLGELPTSPLELTSAYATAANDGIYCTPAPVLSIKDKTGKDIAVKRTPCARVMAPQVARQAATLLVGDTTGLGTSAGVFSSWNSTSGGPVAGKTGTDTVTIKKVDRNTSLWFVGMTPHLVATMALINVTDPLNPLKGVPGITDAAAQSTADGSVAARFWLDALGSTIRAKGKWAWPSSTVVPGSVQLPDLVGLSVDQATQTLKTHNFQVTQYPVDCASKALQGTVGYYGPAYAAPGTTITLCVSTGLAPYTIPPPPKPKPKPTNSATTSGPTNSGSTTGRGRPTRPTNPIPH